MQKQHETCTVEGCERPHKARGYCQTHYMQFKRGVALTPVIKARDMNPPDQCSVGGCAKKVKSKGLCATHYMRLLRHGHTEYTDRTKPLVKCSVAGCDDPALARGICNKHYVRASTWKKFGFSIDDFLRMLEEQGHVCAICNKPEIYTHGTSGKVRDLNVDHCHERNVIRGLLCSNCNRGLGLFADDPERIDRAAAYVRRFVCSEPPSG